MFILPIDTNPSFAAILHSVDDLIHKLKESVFFQVLSFEL